MTIALYAAHQGIINMMMDLLEDHSVNIVDNSVYTDSEPREDCWSDIAIITFPYKGLKKIHPNKKVIIYATDPIVNTQEFLEAAGRPKTVVVGDIDGLEVYPPELYPVTPLFAVPHTIKPKPKYIGDIPAIAIVNRKPHERFMECTGGIPLESFLREVDYHTIHVPSDKLFFETISHYAGVFYFSNNPYTLAMFELMSMGMPIVAYGGCRYSPQTMNKYIGKTYLDPHLVKIALDDIMKNKTPAVYPLLPVFEESKKKWNNIIDYASKL